MTVDRRHERTVSVEKGRFFCSSFLTTSPRRLCVLLPKVRSERSNLLFGVLTIIKKCFIIGVFCVLDLWALTERRGVNEKIGKCSLGKACAEAYRDGEGKTPRKGRVKNTCLPAIKPSLPALFG